MFTYSCTPRCFDNSIALCCILLCLFHVLTKSAVIMYVLIKFALKSLGKPRVAYELSKTDLSVFYALIVVFFSQKTLFR
jgi:hypothetical protein